ncbi:uncharacterized protein LOC6536173 [Drosophila yakuba]|uniref:Drosophila melanogaster n=1 Tax=Drosophila yakuba TaxID=7245 RepID=B4PSL6_DROYA|nr:uncharacterized protein LOC6536173 [Drosophila yakuba]EDW96476.1 uncharacterized protein Dyak_GE24871 [Drosophila yakuba]
MKEILFCVLIMLVCKAYALLPKTYEARFVSITTNGTQMPLDVSQIRFLGRERMANGTFELKEDLDESFSIFGETFIDSMGDGEYKQLLFTAPKQSICKAFEAYWPYFEPSVKFGVNTDFPVHTHPCPLPKGKYYLKDVVLKADNWPVIMPRGFLKAVATGFKNDEYVGSLEIVSKISDLS